MGFTVNFLGMKRFLSCLFLTCLAWLLGLSLQGQVVINEYSASNKDDLMDAFGEYPDWIELYNPSGAPVSLGNLYLSDSPGNLTKWACPFINLGPGQRLLVFASNLDVFDGVHYHTSFKLTQMKAEKILLSNSGGVILDSLTTIPTQCNHSRGRLSDGSPIWGVFTNPTPDAPNASGYYGYAARPAFSLAAGFYPGTQSLVLSSADPGATIRYTTNGDEPTAASQAYFAPISVNASMIVRASVFSSNPTLSASFVESNSYFINANHHQLPVISLASSGFPDLFGNVLWETMTSLEYFDTLGQQQFEMDGDIRRHGNDSWAYPQKGIRFYTRDDYGYANNIDYRLFKETPREEFDVIILKAGGSDNFPGGFQNGLLTCHLRDGFSQTLSQRHNLHLDERSWTPCVIYINGQYWGLYEIRERVDAEYADYYYDQEPELVDMLAYWGGLTVEEGSDTAWNNLYTYMTTHNLSDPVHHAYVDARFDLMSLIDYFILNTYTVNTDWLNWNTAWWRGRDTPGVKWRYRLWDHDNTYNLGQNYTGVNTTTYLNDPCNPTTLFPNDPQVPHSDMLNALMADSVFEALYINRYADLLNTTFRCDTLLAHLQRMVDQLAPEMPNHVARWGGTVADWYTNLDSLRSQILGRCQVVDSLMVGCYTLTGPYDITVLVDPPGSGDVQVNTVVPAGYPYVGGYYGGVSVNLYALNTQNNPFLYWTLNNHALLPGIGADSVHLTLSATDTIVAHFDTTTAVFRDPGITGGYQFRVYPTLVRDRVVVAYQTPAGEAAPQLFLQDMLGHRIADLSPLVTAQGQHQVEVDLSALHLAQGIYLMSFQAPSWNKAEKVVWMGL
jgi:hypothetical protein